MQDNTLTFHWDGYDYPFVAEKSKVTTGYEFTVSFVRDTGNLHQVINFPVHFTFELPNQRVFTSGWIEDRGEYILREIWNSISSKFVDVRNGTIIE